MKYVAEVSEHLLAIDRSFSTMPQDEAEVIYNVLYKHNIDVWTLRQIGNDLRSKSIEKTSFKQR